MTIAYLLVCLSIVAQVAGQLLLKGVGIRFRNFSGVFTDTTLLLQFIAVMVIYGLGMFTWTSALRYLPLSHAYRFSAIGFILIPVFAHFVFGEQLRTVHLFGAVLIVSGIVVSSSM